MPILMMTSTVSEESLVRGTHTHTHRDMVSVPMLKCAKSLTTLQTKMTPLVKKSPYYTTLV